MFQPGDTIQYVDIDINSTDGFENTEYFFAGLAITQGSGSVGEPDSATVFIQETGQNI